LFFIETNRSDELDRYGRRSQTNCIKNLKIMFDYEAEYLFFRYYPHKLSNDNQRKRKKLERRGLSTTFK